MATLIEIRCTIITLTFKPVAVVKCYALFISPFSFSFAYFFVFDSMPDSCDYNRFASIFRLISFRNVQDHFFRMQCPMSNKLVAYQWCRSTRTQMDAHIHRQTYYIIMIVVGKRRVQPQRSFLTHTHCHYHSFIMIFFHSTIAAIVSNLTLPICSLIAPSIVVYIVFV